MSVTAKVKHEIIAKYKTHDKDTGSPEVQIAIISKRIQNLTDHFKQHKKDHSSRRGLIMLVNHRRRLLGFLKKRKPESYQSILKDLKIRG